MTAANYDLYIEQGATYTKPFVWKTVTSNNTQVPVDITGASVRMQIRPSVASATVLFSATTDNGLITVTGEDGRIELTIPATESSLWKWRRGVYDLEVVNGPVVTRLLYGSVEVSPEVTRG